MPTTSERVAVVTGAAQGIGERVAERIAEVLVAEGFAVAGYDREACRDDFRCAEPAYQAQARDQSWRYCVTASESGFTAWARTFADLPDR